MTDEPQREPPKYQSHRFVHAHKIKAITFLADGVCEIVPAEEGYGVIRARPGWAIRCCVDPNRPADRTELGYYVMDENGFTSWSSTTAFEDGYTRID